MRRDGVNHERLHVLRPGVNHFRLDLRFIGDACICSVTCAIGTISTGCRVARLCLPVLLRLVRGRILFPRRKPRHDDRRSIRRRTGLHPSGNAIGNHLRLHRRFLLERLALDGHRHRFRFGRMHPAYGGQCRNGHANQHGLTRTCMHEARVNLCGNQRGTPASCRTGRGAGGSGCVGSGHDRISSWGSDRADGENLPG